MTRRPYGLPLVWLLFPLLLLLAHTGACAKTPPALDPTGTRAWQANQAVVALGELQHAAIEFNKVQICDEAPSACHPIVSDANVRIVIDVIGPALTSLRAAPDGWRTVSEQALDQVAARLDAQGKSKLAGYIQAARAALGLIR